MWSGVELFGFSPVGSRVPITSEVFGCHVGLSIWGRSARNQVWWVIRDTGSCELECENGVVIVWDWGKSGEIALRGTTPHDSSSAHTRLLFSPTYFFYAVLQ